MNVYTEAGHKTIQSQSRNHVVYAYYRVENKANGHIEGQLCCDAQGSEKNVGTGV